MLKNKILPFALLALTHSIVSAQTPTAGSQLRQIPPSPAPQQAAPHILVEQGTAQGAPAADQVKIDVASLRLTGARAYPEATLLALTGFRPGSQLTLSELRAMAAKIEQEYRRNGYFVAQAYLPPQDIRNGAVTIAVQEGRYGQIKTHNQTAVSGTLIDGLLGGLNSGDAVARAPLESRLLLLSDLPGVYVKSTLVPGTAPGAADLVVDVTPGQRISGSVDADNAGSRYTGQNRIGATVNLNEPFGVGDVASLRVLSSGDGLNYARAAYQRHFGRARAGIAYSKLAYKLGAEFESLQARGTAEIASVYVNYPLIRSRNSNLYAQLSYDDKTFHDKVEVAALVTDKKARAATASLYGDYYDGFGGGGMNTYSLSFTAGELDIVSADVRAFDALTARSNGGYRKFGFGASRLQAVTRSLSLYAAINGQLASKNLDVSERMSLGGIAGVRAYPEGEAYGDQGYVVNLEARQRLPALRAGQQSEMHLIGFVDHGSVTRNKNPWMAGDNRTSLSSAGVGLSWADNNNFVVRSYYAHKLGNGMATSAPDKGGRFWIQAVKYF